MSGQNSQPAFGSIPDEPGAGPQQTAVGRFMTVEDDVRIVLGRRLKQQRQDVVALPFVGGGTATANRRQNRLIRTADDSHHAAPGTPRPEIALQRWGKEQRRSDRLVREIGERFDQLPIVVVAVFRDDAKDRADDHLERDRLHLSMD